VFKSIFSDELALDIRDALPIIKSWGLDHVDLRGRVFGKPLDGLSADRLPELRQLFDEHGIAVGCLQSSLAKVHLPDKEGQAAEAQKLENIIRAADALDCRLVRVFHYWQPPAELQGELAVRPDEQQKVLDLFAPLAERARAEGLTLAFENCGVTPDEVLTVADALDVPGWGLAWDVLNDWDSAARRKDEEAYIRRLAMRSCLVHVKACGAVDGYSDELIPYDKVLQACDNAGVKGPVSAETHNPSRGDVDSVEMSQRVVEVIGKAWPTAAPGGLFQESRSAEGVTRPWQDEPVRFVVVGLGMGHSRAKTVAQTPGTELVGVCDIREDRAQKTAEECEVPYKTDLAEWLADDSVEVVYVLTETGRHAEIALQALAAGKHVLTTKPMEASLEACDRMIRLAEEKGLLLGVDFDRRFKTDTNSLKAAIEKGRFGKLLSGTCSLKILRKMEYFKSDGGWRGTRRWDGGGVLSNQSIHHIDEVAFTVGIPSKVRCDIWTQSHEIEAEDLGSAVWLYEDGFALTLHATTSYPHATWYYSMELVGEKGAYFDAAGGPFEKRQCRWFLGEAWQDKAPEHQECEWLNAADNFAAAVRSGAELACSGRAGRGTQSILDAMYRSAYDNGGGWVEVAAEMP